MTKLLVDHDKIQPIGLVSYVSMEPGEQILESFCFFCITLHKTGEAAACSASAVATALLLRIK